LSYVRLAKEQALWSASNAAIQRPNGRNAMPRYIIRRLLWTVFTVVLVTFITFVIYFVLPPSNVAYESFTHGGLTARASELTKHYLGLDRPFHVQYALFLKHFFMGDPYGWPGLWSSFQTRSALKPIIAARAVVTLQLTLGAAVIWLAIGLPIGICRRFGRGRRSTAPRWGSPCSLCLHRHSSLALRPCMGCGSSSTSRPEPVTCRSA
jgi:ABC-type microcin C transport system permease subunit YejB